MSIVITVIDHTLKNLYMYGDKRRSVISETGFDRYDDINKVFKLKDDLLIGITGLYESGIAQVEHLKKFVDELPISSVLLLAEYGEAAEVVINGAKKTTTLIIAGKDEDGRLFLWTKQGNSKPKIDYGKIGDITFSISTFDDKMWSFANDKFTKNLTKHGLSAYEKSIKDTIIHVSEIDESVSPTFDSFRLSF